MKWWVLFINTICVMMLALSTTGLMTALPAMQEELYLTPLMARWVLSGYIASGTLTIMLAGCLGDRWGYFRFLSFGMFLFSIIGFIIAGSSVGEIVVAARVIQGGAAAIISALVLSSLNIAFPPQQRAFAISVWGALVSLGFGSGALVGGMLATYTSWRVLFISISCMTFIAAIANSIFARHYPRPLERTPIDLKGIGLLIGWMAPLIYWIMVGNNIGWMSPLSGSLLIVTLVFFAAFAWRMWYVPNALISRDLLKNSQLMGSVFLFFITLFSIISFFFFYNRFIQWPLLHNMSSVRAGYLLIPANAAMFLTALCSSWIGRKIGFRPLLIIGMSSLIIGFLSLSIMPLNEVSWGYLFPLIVLGIGFGATVPVVPHIGLRSLPDHLQGKGSGLLNTVNYLGGSMAIAFGSVIYLKTAAKTLFSLDIKTVDKLLLGSRQEIFDWVGLVPQIIELQSAAVSGFSYLMMMSSVWASLGLLCTSVILKGKN